MEKGLIYRFYDKSGIYFKNLNEARAAF